LLATKLWDICQDLCKFQLQRGFSFRLWHYCVFETTDHIARLIMTKQTNTTKLVPVTHRHVLVSYTTSNLLQNKFNKWLTVSISPSVTQMPINPLFLPSQ